MINKDELNNNFNVIKEEFEDCKSALLKKSVEFDTEKTKLNNFILEKEKDFSNLEIQKKEISEYYKELLEENEQNYNIKKEIENAKQEINNYKKELLEDDTAKKSIKTRIDNLYNQILEKKNKICGCINEGGQYNIGLINEFDNKIKEIDNLKTEKEKEIEKLLKDMNLSKDAIAQDSLSRFFSDISNKKHIHSKNTLIWLFINNFLIVGVLFLGFKYIIFSNNELVNFIVRLTITFPFVYFMFNLTLKYKRDIALEDQYNYKASIMATYRTVSSFLKYEEIENKDKQFEILENTFNKILENEADKIDKKDKNLLDSIDKIINSFSKVFAITKEESFNLIECVISQIKKNKNL